MKRLLAVVVWIALAGVLSAKGATVRIVITGGDLKQALDVRSATELQSFQVWAGAGVTVSGNPQTSGFIVHWRGGTVAEPPATLPRYEVAFYAARDITAEGELAYVVTYVFDPATRIGLVYLPGASEPHGTMNMRNIYRGGLEGHWLQSTVAWDEWVVPQLGR